MSFSLRITGAVSLALLAALTQPAPAQRRAAPFGGSPALQNQIPFPINPNFQVAPNLMGRQAAYNMAVLGSGLAQVPPAAMGVPFGGPVGLGAPALAAGLGGVSPYALSTIGGYNPYMGTGATLDAGGYGLSTSPGGMGGAGMFPGYGFTPNSMGYGYGLMGIADYTRASGQYWKDIQQARMTREKVRQEELETAKRRVLYEAWYETMRPTGAKMRDAEIAADLDRARKDPPDTEVQSGRALNTLLQAIQKQGKLNRATSSELNDETLKHINLTAGTSAGNVGLLKDPSKMDWPDALLEPAYEEARKGLTSSLRKAVDAVKDRERPTTALRKDIDAYFKQMNDRLNEAADEMSAQQYIDARRFMNQLGSAIKALKDPKVDNYFNNTWTAKGKNVAELVENMSRDGLSFAPAAPGDEPSYKALYLALRNFESALQGESR